MKQTSIVSKDGTRIAFELSGSGPLVILVDCALADRGGTAKLAKHLSVHFTVINYDRRGRGKSTDTPPYAVAREVEDIGALIDSSGAPAFLFGSSSGAVLALEAANCLKSKVAKLFLYEPPFIVDGSRAAMPDGFSREISELVEAGRRNDAVKLFFAKGMGIPGSAVTLMRWLMPGWSKMVSMAHTIPYDLEILSGTQDGKPLPAGRWASVTADCVVMVGSRSEAFFHCAARALADSVAHCEYRVWQGQGHAAVLMAAKGLAQVVRGEFERGRRSSLTER